MALPEYSKIINRITRNKFKPFGITQKGQSRLWLDDRGWFTTVIEFQPFLGIQGTALNIGVNFHWCIQDYFSFDIGCRQDVGFIEYRKNDEKLLNEVEKLCEISIRKILEYRNMLKNIYTAKYVILNHTFTSEEIWGSYHKGTICGLTKDFTGLNKYYQKLLNETHPGEWLTELKQKTMELLIKTENEIQFKEYVVEIIKKTRKLKKLPETEMYFDVE